MLTCFITCIFSTSSAGSYFPARDNAPHCGLNESLTGRFGRFRDENHAMLLQQVSIAAFPSYTIVAKQFCWSEL